MNIKTPPKKSYPLWVMILGPLVAVVVFFVVMHFFAKSLALDLGYFCPKSGRRHTCGNRLDYEAGKCFRLPACS